MNKNYMKETITFTAKDKDGNKIKSTPHLFMEALAKAVGTDVAAVKTKISKSSSKFKKKLEEVLNEERLPTGGELMSLTTILGTRKDKVEKAFVAMVKDTISSNGTKASEVNTLNLQFTWPKTWGEDVKDIGSAICEVFNSKDFVKDALFCNFTASNNTIEVGADSGKFESAQSFGKLIEALRTVINYIYINSPFETSVNELDEPMYKLVDDAVYSTLHEVALNGVEEGVDLAPLQKYLYQKGVVDLPNVKGDRVMGEEDEYITFKFKVHNKKTLEQFKHTNGKTEVIIDPASYTDPEYNSVISRIRDILRGEYKKLTTYDLYPEALMTSIWEMMYEEKERAAFWQLYNLVKDEHADYNGKLYKNLEEYVIRKGLALYKPTGFNLENIKKENINTTIKAIAKMVADYIGFDVKDVVFTLFHDGDMLTSTGDSDRLDTIARHSEAWYEEVTRKQNVSAVETAKSSVPQQNTSRPTVVIKATNVGTSVISSIAEAYNGNVDIRVETEQVGKTNQQ